MIEKRQVPVDLDGLKALARLAERLGSEAAFIRVFLQWAEKANTHIAILERDRLILAARLYSETDFAPETAEVMDRMRPLVEAEMKRTAQ